MAERENKIGKKPAHTNFASSPACGQWETLLVDALDGLLKPEDEATFSGHMATCDPCGAMFEEARRGREWLEFLAPEPEVPAYLLDKILVGTGHGKLDLATIDPARLVVAGGPASGDVLTMPPVWQRPGFAARMRRFAEPRLMMTAAMAFFSIALTLSLTGVRFSAMKLSDLRPTALRSVVEKRIMTESTPIIRYYDHLRFVYEVESTVKELRRSSETDQQSQPSQQKDKPSSNGEGESHKKDGGSKLNPNEAPQQTVNPPSRLWSGETLETELRVESRVHAGPKFNTVQFTITKGIPALGSSQLAEASGKQTNENQANLLKMNVLAVQERSKSCLA
jgi:hypothetical protein